MPETLHEKLVELQQELETLKSIREQVEESDTRSAAVITGASETLARAAAILGQIDKLTRSVEDLVERTDDVDFPAWLKNLDEVVRTGLNAVSTELKNTSLAVTKTIQDEYSVIRADQSAAQERFQEKLEDIHKSVTEQLDTFQLAFRDMDAKHVGLITDTRQELTSHGEAAAKNATAIKGDLVQHQSAITELHQELLETSHGLSKKITIVMVLAALALLVSGSAVALQFLQ